MIKAISGISIGIVLYCVGMFGGFFLDPHQDLQALWVTLCLSAWVVLSWGMVNFAKYRGHQGAVGCGLMVIGLFVDIFILFRAYNIWAFAIGFIFVAALPIAVLLSLPKGSNLSRHRNKRHHH